MLEGLEAVELKLSEVLQENEKLRIDSGYFAKDAIRTEELIEKLPCGFTTLGEITSCFRKGIFDIKAETYTETGVPFVRISNLRGGLIDDSDIVFIPEQVHKAESKTALAYGDLVISKTAYPAASFVNLERCNTSQDTIAVRINTTWKKKMVPAYLVAYLNSRHGIRLMERQFQGNVQMHLSLADGERVKIPLFSSSLQTAVHDTFIASFRKLTESRSIYHLAEQTLLRALGLEEWQPPEPLTYERKATEAFFAGRLDSQYFSPRVQALIQILSRDDLTVGDVARLRKQYFNPLQHETFQYIEIGGVTSSGEVNSSTVPADETPDRATWHVRHGDIVTSTVRPIRRLSALIHPEQDGFVCSSGFAVLEPFQVPAELLLVYLRLPLIAELMDLHTTASLYPAISIPDILKLPFVQPAPEVVEEVAKGVRASHAARKLAHALLERAKRAVEIAVEENETAGLKFLNNGGNQ